MPVAIESSSEVAVDMLWAFFKSERRWPTRKEFLLSAIDSGLPLGSLRRSPDLSFRSGSGDDARPTFTALRRIPEVRELLSPLPLVLRQAASSFAAQALIVPENTLPTFHFREVKGHWSSSAIAMRAFSLLRSTGSGLFVGGGASGTDPEDFYFSLSLDTLRYEHVQTLDDVFRVPRYSEVKDAGRFPSGRHLDLLRRVFEASKSEQRWPRSLGFALAARDVGHVPDLVTELRPRFIRTEFQASQRSSLILTLDALPFVDQGETRDALLKAVAGIVAIWRDRSDQVEISLAELASVTGVVPSILGPAVAFLESSKWCHLGHVSELSHAHIVITPGDPEFVLRNLEVDSFDDYMRTWDAEDGYDAELFVGGLSSAYPPSELEDVDIAPLAVPSMPVNFLKSTPYRRVFETDLVELQRTLSAGAWKASLILIGGLLEGALLDVLARRADITESLMRRKMHQASLGDLIPAGVRLKLLQPSVEPFASVAKDYRDLTHPFRSAASALRPARESVSATLHVLNLVIRDLDEASRDGRISQFELSG